MGDLFNALSAGLARFVYAWIVPSVVTVGVFVVLVGPSFDLTVAGPLPGIAAYSLAVITSSVVFAYGALPIYRLLEGYTLPGPLKGWLQKRSMRRFVRLQAQRDRGSVIDQQIAHEQLQYYPETRDLVLPTRLGNALKSMETYGVSRFKLDTQTLWYELQAAATDKIRRHTEDARAGVDFFISSLSHLVALAVVSLGVGIQSGDAQPVVVAVVSLILTVPAYRQAVKNVGEWRYAVQALVNTGREPLAASLTLSLPSSLDEEREMWEAFGGFVNYGYHEDYRRVIDLRSARRQVRDQSGRDGTPEVSLP